jgi:DNA-binding MarR family transcriptional regulator
MESDLGNIEAAIASLGRLADLFQRRRVQLARGVELTVQQWRVLEEVSTEHFLPSLFARERECTAAAVSKTLRQLLGKGLIRVAISSKDGRQRRYELTGEGHRVIEQLRDERRRAIRAIWSDLPGEEVARFARFAGELGDRLACFSRQLVDQPTRNDP